LKKRIYNFTRLKGGDELENLSLIKYEVIEGGGDEGLRKELLTLLTFPIGKEKIQENKPNKKKTTNLNNLN